MSSRYVSAVHVYMLDIFTCLRVRKCQSACAPCKSFGICASNWARVSARAWVLVGLTRKRRSMTATTAELLAQPARNTHTRTVDDRALAQQFRWGH